ncbi:MAG: NUDIX domain-containing protein [Nitrospiraceae bacterium]|nr:NUDIX domain-containing protein [Nitrospiraceae bacterium]
MAQEKKRSFGIVPIAFDSDGSPLFLILRAYRNWDFPKGVPESGETPLETATREFFEETGIREFSLAWGEMCKETKPYFKGKVALYYPVQTEKRMISLPVSQELGRPEHSEYRWVRYDEGRRLLPSRLIPVLEWAMRLATEKDEGEGPS